MATRRFLGCDKLPRIQPFVVHQRTAEKVKVSRCVEVLPGWVDLTDSAQENKWRSSDPCKGKHHIDFRYLLRYVWVCLCRLDPAVRQAWPRPGVGDRLGLGSRTRLCQSVFILYQWS